MLERENCLGGASIGNTLGCFIFAGGVFFSCGYRFYFSNPGLIFFKPGSRFLQTRVCISSDPGLGIMKPGSGEIKTPVLENKNPGMKIKKGMVEKKREYPQK